MPLTARNSATPTAAGNHRFFTSQIPRRAVEVVKISIAVARNGSASAKSKNSTAPTPAPARAARPLRPRSRRRHASQGERRVAAGRLAGGQRRRQEKADAPGQQAAPPGPAAISSVHAPQRSLLRLPPGWAVSLVCSNILQFPSGQIPSGNERSGKKRPSFSEGGRSGGINHFFRRRRPAPVDFSTGVWYHGL